MKSAKICWLLCKWARVALVLLPTFFSQLDNEIVPEICLTKQKKIIYLTKKHSINGNQLVYFIEFLKERKKGKVHSKAVGIKENAREYNERLIG